MSRKRVPYDFCPLPRKRAPGWAGLKHMLGNCLPEKLWQLNDGEPIAIDGDWRVSLCRTLAINSRHRTNWCQAMDEAHRAGLLSVSATHVTVHFIERPTADQPATNLQPTATQHATNCDPTETLLATNLESTPRNDSTPVRQTDRRDRRDIHTDGGGLGPQVRKAEPKHFRRPVGDPPPDAWTAQAEPTAAPPLRLSDFAIGAYRKRHLEKPGTWPAETNWHNKSAADLATWCERPENLKAFGCTAEQLVERVLDGLFADTQAAEAGYKLSWALNRTEQYARGSQRRPKLEMHQPWKPLEYRIPEPKPMTPEQRAKADRERAEQEQRTAELRELGRGVWEVAQ